MSSENGKITKKRKLNLTGVERHCFVVSVGFVMDMFIKIGKK